MKKGLVMSRAQAEAHQRKHGFMKDDALSTKIVERIHDKFIRLNSGMNKTEHEYSLILEAMKRRGEILDYNYHGIRLAWGRDKETGKVMHYTADFVVRYPPHYLLAIVLVEVKGAHIWSRDLVRFKGCRAEWQWAYEFEMHQKKAGEWKRIA